MAKISAILVDTELNILAPALIDLETFEVQRLASIYDTIERFNPDKVGIYTDDYKQPVRLYAVEVGEDGIFVYNTQAKKAIRDWSQDMETDIADEVELNQKIMREQNVIAQAISSHKAATRHKI